MSRLAVFVATAVTALCLVPQASTFAEDPPSRVACHDGIDNDGDGAIDHPADADCDNPHDETEESLTGPSSPPACSDGIDNDADGAADYPADPDCASADDPSEAGPPPCETVDSVTACMGYAVGGEVDSFTATLPSDSLLHVAGFIHLYRFTLPNGAVVTAPCVVLGAHGNAVNPCKAAGGTFVERLKNLVNDNFESRDVTVRTPLTTVRVCTADIVMTLNGAGVDRYPAYAVC